MGVWKSLQSKFSKSTGEKVIILGLDGAPYTLIKQFIQDGTMPNLARIVQEGTLSQMDTSIPEISSVAWTTFFTGVNAARHGIYGFMDLKPNSYDMYFPNSHNVRAKTLWEKIGEHGKRSVVVNVPSTYPAKPLNGILISGFVAIDLAKATYPPSLLPMLERVNYQLDVDSAKARESLELFANSLLAVLEAREKVLWDLLVQEQWDLFVGVITETDRMHHYLWAAIEDLQHPYHDFFKSFYTRVDRFIGKVYEWFHKKGVFMIMSDHGFCKIQKEVYLNNWLSSEGYLKFSTPNPQSYGDLDKASKAFNMDPARIYIHLKGKYPYGSVSPGSEYDSLREELKSRLLDIKVDGAPVIQRVFLKEEIFKGPFLNEAPDLLLLPNWGFDIKGTITKSCFTGNSLLTGMHTQNDSTFFINVKHAPKERVNIMNIAPTALKATGVEVDGDFDAASLI
jgi:predicted AlkP superfamily phosphohydrolase/phosphomutase